MKSVLVFITARKIVVTAGADSCDCMDNVSIMAWHLGNSWSDSSWAFIWSVITLQFKDNSIYLCQTQFFIYQKTTWISLLHCVFVAICILLDLIVIPASWPIIMFWIFANYNNIACGDEEITFYQLQHIVQEKTLLLVAYMCMELALGSFVSGLLILSYFSKME